MIPSITDTGISWSGDQEESMMAFPRMRQRDSLPKNWLVTSFSSKPLLLARAVLYFKEHVHNHNDLRMTSWI